MKLILDTNCYISFLNKRNEQQHQKMVEFWEAVSRAEFEVIVISHNLTEISFVFQSIYNIDKSKIKTILSDLLQNPGVHYECGYFPELIFSIWQKQIKDYGDAVLAAASISLSSPTKALEATTKRNDK
jgi:predicted nucleic acid-binding protein